MENNSTNEILLKILDEIKKSRFTIEEDSFKKTNKLPKHNLQPRDLSQNCSNLDKSLFLDTGFKDDISNWSNLLIQNIDSHFDLNLFFSGGCFTGKTYISNCIANELIADNRTVRKYTSIDLFTLIEESLIHTRNNDRSEYKFLLECDLLIIDNLGLELVNSFTISHLINIIDTRLSKYKKTILISNFPLSGIFELYSGKVFYKFKEHFKFIMFKTKLKDDFNL